MTQLPRDLHRMSFAPRTMSVFARSPKCFLLVLLFFLTGSFASVAAPMQSSDNPAAKPAPAAQQAPAASNDSTPLKNAVHQKKVITEDDLSKPSKPISLKDLDGEESNSICNLSCEELLRDQLGYGPDREAEFRNQLTLARHEIAADKVWNSYLDSALQAENGYCEIERQKAQILGKGVVPSYTRDNVNSRFAERERKFVLQHREAEGYLEQRIQAVQRFDPFRAAVMQHYWGEATRVCPYSLPSQ